MFCEIHELEIQRHIGKSVKMEETPRKKLLITVGRVNMVRANYIFEQCFGNTQACCISNEICSVYYMSIVLLSHLCQIITALKGRIAVIMKECVVKVLLGFNHQNIHSQHAHAHLPPTLLHKYTLSVSHSADKSPWLQ